MSDNYFTPQIEGHPHLAPIACDPTEWIRCPRCGWPGTVEGRCAQCGLDYMGDLYEDEDES